MKKYIGILLIVGSIGLGYVRGTKFTESRKSIGILDAKITIKDESSQTNAIVFMGLAVVALAGGVVLLRNK